MNTAVVLVGVSSEPQSNLAQNSGQTVKPYGATPRRKPSYETVKHFNRFFEMYGVAPSFVELGCGAGGVSARLSRLGASVIAIDLDDHLCASAKAACASGKMRFIKKPMQSILWEDLPEKIDGIIAERCLHWVNYKAALIILRKCAARMRPDGVLHMSLGALTKENPLMENYSFDQKTPITQRHGGNSIVSNNIDRQAVPYINSPRTLYTEDEAIKLLSHSGFSSVHTWMTSSGSLKIHAVRDDRQSDRLEMSNAHLTNRQLRI